MIRWKVIFHALGRCGSSNNVTTQMNENLSESQSK